MPRALRFGLALLALPVLVALALAATAPFFLERIGLASAIETAVQDATAYRLTIDGEPRLRLFPQPRVELGPLTLTGDNGRQTAIVRHALLRIRVAALPLMAGRFELRRATVEAERLIFPGDLDIAPGWSLPSIGPFEIRDAHIDLSYPSDVRGPAWALFSVAAGPIALGERGRLVTTFEADAISPGLKGRFKLSAAIRPRPDPVTSLEARQLRELIRISDLRLRGSDLVLGMGRAAEPGPETGFAAALEADAIEYEAGAWRVPALSLTSGSLHIDATLDLRGSDTGYVLSSRFAVSGFDPRAWLGAQGYDLGFGTNTTLRCSAARGRMELDQDGISLESALLVDATLAAGSVSLLLGTERSTVAALVIDGIDIDPYLVDGNPTALVAGADAGPDCRLPTASAINAPVLPARPAGADLFLQLEAGTLRVGGVRFGRLAADLVGRGGLTTAELEIADFYTGNLSADLERDVRGAGVPHQRLRGQADGIDVAALLNDLADEPTLSGTGHLRADLAASGADLAALKADLSGTLAAEVRDGRLLGLDLEPAVAAVGGDPAIAAGATAFTALSATAVGSGGLFLTDDIAGRSPNLLVTGTGRVDVPAETLDLDLEATFVEPPNGNGLSALAGLRVPMAVTGSWQRPVWRPDLGPALREVARRALIRNRDALRDIEQRTGIQGLEQGLRGLLGF